MSAPAGAGVVSIIRRLPTVGLDSYLLAAHGRRRRYKVRTRTYVDSAISFLEVKTEGAREATVKERMAAAGSAGMVVTPGTSSTQSGVQVTLGSTVPAGTVVQIADSAGTVLGTFVTTKATASLVFSSAAITEGEEYTVYTGGTATVSAGIGEGSLDGADQVSTVTAGQYTAEGMGGGGGFGGRR